MQNSFEAERAPVKTPNDRSTAGSPTAHEYRTAAEHEKAAMLAEFNGTYELARFHRERAARLRQVKTNASG